MSIKRTFINHLPALLNRAKGEHGVTNLHRTRPPLMSGSLKPVLAKLLLLLVILVLGGITVFGCTARGTQPQGWSGVTVADGTLFFGSMKGQLIALDKSNGSSRWAVTLETPKSSGGFGCAPTSTAAAIYGTPVVAGDLSYVGAYLYIGNKAYGKVYAFNTTSGALRWVYPRQGNLGGAIIGGLIAAGDKVYFGASNGKVYALDAATGDWRWDSPTGGEIWSTPAIDGDTLYIGSFDKKLYALDITNGNQKWAPFETGGAIASDPVIHNNTVYFGSFDRRLYAVDTARGTLKWKSELEAGSWFWAKPLIINNMVYTASLDGQVYALDTDSGRLVTEFDLGSSISSSPVLVNGSIIVATEDSVLYSLDTSSNQEKRLADIQALAEEELAIYSPLAADEGIIFVHTQTKKYGSHLYALDASTGIRVWRYPPPGSK